MFPEQIETDRLRLEQLCHENVDVFELYHRFVYGEDLDEVFEYIPQNQYQTVQEAQDRIDNAENHWVENEAAEYVVRPKNGENGAGELAGITSLQCQWERRTGQLGLILLKPFWGRGYSRERAEALMNLAFSRLELELVTAGHTKGNEKSKRAIKKYIEAHGGQYDGLLRNWIPMNERISDLHRYTVTQDQYREK